MSITLRQVAKIARHAVNATRQGPLSCRATKKLPMPPSPVPAGAPAMLPDHRIATGPRGKRSPAVSDRARDCFESRDGDAKRPAFIAPAIRNRAGGQVLPMPAQDDLRLTFRASVAGPGARDAGELIERLSANGERLISRARTAVPAPSRRRALRVPLDAFVEIFLRKSPPRAAFRNLGTAGKLIA